MQSYTFALNSDNFNSQVMTSSRPWLVEFYSPTCMHCRELVPVLQQVAYNVGNFASVGTIDGDANNQLSSTYKI